MRKNKKLLLGGLSVLTLVAAGSGAVSTFAWFQATSATTLAMTSTATVTPGVDYDEFDTGVGTVAVTLTFEEQTTSKVLGLCHYYSSDSDAQTATGNNEAEAGWHQAYITAGGTVVWDSGSAPSKAYGNGANAYYRVYKIKATWRPTADQCAATIANHVINGSVTITDDDASDNCMLDWTTTTAPNNDGKTSVPAGTFDQSTKAFVKFDIGAPNTWTADADNTAYSTSYFCVSCDGVIHDHNDDVTATLGFTSVSVTAS